MKNEKATADQITSITDTLNESIAYLLTEKGLSFEQAEILLDSTDKKILNQVSRELVEKVLTLVPPDPLFSYKKDLETFFKDIYKIDLNLSKVSFPEIKEFIHYMVVPPKCDTGAIYSSFVMFDLSYTKYTDKGIIASTKDEPLRPRVLYGFAHRGGTESDQKHAGKSYRQFIIEACNYMTIKEYMLCCQFMWWKYKILFDQGNCTITATLAKDNVAMHAYCRKNTFKLGCTHFTKSTPGYGPREIMLL